MQYESTIFFIDDSQALFVIYSSLPSIQLENRKCTIRIKNSLRFTTALLPKFVEKKIICLSTDLASYLKLTFCSCCCYIPCEFYYKFIAMETDMIIKMDLLSTLALLKCPFERILWNSRLRYFDDENIIHRAAFYTDMFGNVVLPNELLKLQCGQILGLLVRF